MSDVNGHAAGENMVGAVLEVRSDQGLAQAIFTRESERRKLKAVVFLSQAAELSDREALDVLGEKVWSRGSDYLHERVIVTPEDCVSRVLIGRGTVDIVVAARTENEANEVKTRIAELFKPPKRDPSQVPITFWSESDGGGSRAHRKIECPDWTDLSCGYSHEAAACMARLTDMKEPDGGRLVLWFGPPGTGKTHAIKCLARSWQDWCACHLVTDPEKFLESSQYAMDVLTSRDPEFGMSRTWNLVVLEDSGELLRNDAREKTGQALSRLLNLTDGLLGQGLNALVLITTNEPVGRLHPAVTRPGRCLEKAEFGPLPADQANDWLKAAGSNHRVTRTVTLASLFALVKDQADPGQIHNTLPTVGFAAA